MNSVRMIRVIFRNPLVITILLLFGYQGIAPTYGQKEVLYEQYQQSPVFINPAFTGIREDFNMTLQLRRRWFTYQNSPVSQTFSADGTIADGKIGLGVQALNDNMSPFQTTGVYGSGSWILNPSGEIKISFGIQGGINILPVYDSGFNRSNNKALASAGAGVWIQNDQFYGGISLPEILNHSYGTSSIANTIYNRPLYLMGGANFKPDEKWLIIPNLLFARENNQKLRFDIGTRLWYDERAGIGVTYRTGPVNYVAVSGELQVSKNIRLGYVYNSKPVETRQFSQTNPVLSIHEILLKFVPSPSGFHKN